MSLLSEEVRARLIGIYTGPDRHYHDLRHIRAMLALAKEHAGDISDREAVEAAIWFHDAVYDTRRANNEPESAKFAMELLAGGVAEERLGFIAAMIRASAKHGIPDSMLGGAAKDCALFLDMDLGVLGSPAAEFDAYERAVRLEYGWVPEEAWVAGRSEVLRRFLARPFIYATPQFRESHEATARSNLTRSLARLEGAHPRGYQKTSGCDITDRSATALCALGLASSCQERNLPWPRPINLCRRRGETSSF